MNRYKDYGFKLPTFEPEHYTFGSGLVPEVILAPDGSWGKWIPLGEVQNEMGIETWNCSGFATLNAIETLINRIYGKTVNYSDRFLGIVAGTKPFEGNDPHAVAEAVRKNGLTLETMLPFSGISNVQEYYSFKGANEYNCRQEGKKWLGTDSFKHEWVLTPATSRAKHAELIKAALKLSPVDVSVTAWIFEDGKYVDNGLPNTHWTTIIDYKEGDYWLVYDSYTQDGEFLKRVDWNHNFACAKRYHVAEIIQETSQSFIAKLVSLFSFLKQANVPVNLPPLVMTETPVPTNEPTVNSIKLYYTAKGLIGRHLTLNNYVPAEVGCVECLSYLLKTLNVSGIPSLGFEGTAEIASWMQTSGLFKEMKISEALVGDIIISISRPNFHGHVAVIGKMCLLSNNSLTGKLDTHLYLSQFINYYTINGLKIKVFRLQ